MSELRKIEIFSAGCPLCEDTIALVNRMACPSCEISVLDMNDPEVAKRAREIGVRSVPAVAVNGELAPCCTGRRVTEDDLRSAGVGQPLA
jgi:glutaredoxin